MIPDDDGKSDAPELLCWNGYSSIWSLTIKDWKRTESEENRKRDRTRRGLRKGNGGDTGGNDEHKGVNVTNGNQFYQKHHVSFAYNRAFYRKWRMEVRVRHRVISVDSDGRLLVLCSAGGWDEQNYLPMMFRRRIYRVVMATWSNSAVAEQYFFAGFPWYLHDLDNRWMQNSERNFRYVDDVMRVVDFRTSLVFVAVMELLSSYSISSVNAGISCWLG